MGERELRICIVGDELSVGVGDAKGLGWAGRVIARSRFDRTAMSFPLAIPGETTTALSQRWEVESFRRYGNEAECDNRLVVGLGRHDVAAGLSVARSRLNLANMLDVADSHRISTFVVGPPRAPPRTTTGWRSCRPPSLTSLPVATSPTSTRSRRSCTTSSGSRTSPRAARATRRRPATG
ncbi:hypothetical protein GCM10025865_22310 [Paraoerskovia sediminicola]|uniref:GDSL-like Lipase/Acylhydrolase family protein n=1 Tax=Paraoerskovia sediminicola TaxID=1138587 RepID=A0ABN6XGW4_9CELL|nr:hypothetical protein GCM10025865_22310 [Paraoerskovia sediminicola]